MNTNKLREQIKRIKLSSQSQHTQIITAFKMIADILEQMEMTSNEISDMQRAAQDKDTVYGPDPIGDHFLAQNPITTPEKTMTAAEKLATRKKGGK